MKKLLLILLLIPSVLFSAQLHVPSTGTGDVSNGVMSTSSFMVEVAKGNVPGHSVVNKFGKRPFWTNNKIDIERYRLSNKFFDITEGYLFSLF